MKKIIYYFAIIAGLFVAAYVYFEVFNMITEFQLLLYSLLALFLVIFGLYGLKAESLMKKFRANGKTDNFCIEASYYAKNKGVLGKLFLFPFMKVKSKNSLVISFLGSVAWVVILLIVLKLFIK
jgi:hypothetical protein